MQYNSLRINSGVTLTPDRYRIYVRGSLVNNGTISTNGANATANNSGNSVGTGSLPGGDSGETGRLTAGAGTAPTPLNWSYDDFQAGRGNGGDGGANAGGVPAEPVGGVLLDRFIGDVVAASSFFLVYNESALALTGGPGGCSGGFAAGGSGYSGAGGAGAENIFVAAQTLVNTNGTITARGGNGSAAVGTGALGGGGGGGGALIILVTLELHEGTIIYSGGTGGAGANGGTAGGNGENGQLYKISGV